ncbi:hypothetical protein [Actinoplanes sp. NBRC 101535]|uniref:hypothetical protein n=1 Tax=Actinoplanes sp. NBRC 101535 TaxID=3032196 RepID=UPI0024A348D2|nr:hypothetical protein [Actinoplanes sp. NBRC 101535]GLY03207.1 hypothetical protein Acsp01_35860 [Actinoplanes sp. NBRC 101535]
MVERTGRPERDVAVDDRMNPQTCAGPCGDAPALASFIRNSQGTVPALTLRNREPDGPRDFRHGPDSPFTSLASVSPSAPASRLFDSVSMRADTFRPTGSATGGTATGGTATGDTGRGDTGTGDTGTDDARTGDTCMGGTGMGAASTCGRSSLAVTSASTMRAAARRASTLARWAASPGV